MQLSYKTLKNIAGWLTFAIAAIVYYFSVESTVSLWDCGEFILAAYKLEVVHPPGAPLFLMIGRIFAWLGDILSDNPSHIAVAVNLMSATATAFMAMFVALTTVILTKIALVGRSKEPILADSLISAGAGLVAGLTSAFATSIWFSAVEGEVYALSSFFTAATVWAAVKWYDLPDDREHDRYLVLAFFLIGLSIGVHLLSLLTLPLISILYYFKRFEKHSFVGYVLAGLLGTAGIVFIQKFLIAGIPWLWSKFDLFAVNTLGLPFNSGIVFVILVIGGLLLWGFRLAHRKKSHLLQITMMAATLMVLAYTSYGMVVLRANANPPINMSEPYGPMRLLSYLNREQYGERPLLWGPHYEAQPIGIKSEPRYGRVGDRYEIVDHKLSYEYSDKDKMLFPRISHTDQNRPKIYRMWNTSENKKPTMAFNISFFLRYQLGWMYWRYFMWNFVGRQNGKQGFYPWDLKSGHYLSGIKPIDEWHLYNMDKLPDRMKNDPARNTYYFIPLILGLLGMWFQYRKSPKEFYAILALFIITGIGIIIYSNQPPNEPRERDYVLAGSFFTFAMWVGMGAAALYTFLKKYIQQPPIVALVSTLLALSAPTIMGVENFDDHSRRGHYAARDYAINFLESLSPNAILFTYGDNDTYPLWYVQEVEGIRRDVRVINLSLIAVDWYINSMRRKVNESPPIKFTIPAEAYVGDKRNMVPFPEGLIKNEKPWPIDRVLRHLAQKNPVSTRYGDQVETFLPTRKIYIPVNKKRALEIGMARPTDSIVDKIWLNLGNVPYLRKDEIAVMDIIGSNIWDRPIYFAITVRERQMLGLQPYLRLEGLAYRITAVKTDQQRRDLSVFGLGHVDTDLVYKRIMNKFRWGNFDKYDTYVNTSYAPSVQAMKYVMLRVAMELIDEGKKDKAIKLIQKQFEAFPNMNFPFDYQTVSFFNELMRAGDRQTIETYLPDLIDNLIQDLEFYHSLDDEDLQSFEMDVQLTTRALFEVFNILQYLGEDSPVYQEYMPIVSSQLNLNLKQEN